MKIPNLLPCLMLCFCSYLVQSQNQSLSTFPAAVYASSQKSIVESAKDASNYKMLMQGLKAANLEEALDNSGPFTIFAPTDRAFYRLPNAELDRLGYLTDVGALGSLLKYHVVAGRLTASKILRAMCKGEGIATFTTIHGEKITASMRGTDIVLTDSNGNSAMITSADSTYRNGVVHQIDSVIIPSRL